jgi:hypothetical protein
MGLIAKQAQWSMLIIPRHPAFDFIDTSYGYRREGIGNDAETSVSENPNLKYGLVQILVK